jgi:hypothetical protein
VPPNVAAAEIPWQKCRELHRPTSARGESAPRNVGETRKNLARPLTGSGTRRTAADTKPPRIGLASVSPPTQAKSTAPSAPTTSQAARTHHERSLEYPRFWLCGLPRDYSQLRWRERSFACCKRPPEVCGDRADEWSYEKNQLILSPPTGNLNLRSFRRCWLAGTR